MNNYITKVIKESILKVICEVQRYHKGIKTKD